ncbi:MAG: hypothetical protein ACLQVA_04895 [Candidatus Brocadiia bacterium]
MALAMAVILFASGCATTHRVAISADPANAAVTPDDRAGGSLAKLGGKLRKALVPKVRGKPGELVKKGTAT